MWVFSWSVTKTLLVGTDDVRSKLRQAGRLAIDLADILAVLLIGNGVLELVFRALANDEEFRQRAAPTSPGSPAGALLP